MALFGPLYDRVMRWAAHPHAVRYLAGLSAAESSFFPIPPDVMLAPMTLARPQRAWTYALVTTVASVAGGVVGYFLGFFLLELIEPVIAAAGYTEAYGRAQAWFDSWGAWVLLIAGFSPVPYKIFTVASGALAMSMPLFVVISLIGRGCRFYLVAGAMRWGGAPMERLLRQHIEWLGWVVGLAALALIGYLSV